ncbi:MAG: hypothetical protein R2710_21610 [Acidimicrobiales bacterium]
MNALPTSSQAITVDWLNIALSDEVRDGARVTKVDAEVIGEGVGFIGEVARLTLTYDAPTPSSTTSMISKLPTTNEGFKHLGLMLGFYEKESGFFRDVAPEIQLRIPACFHNAAHDNDFILLLEDLADAPGTSSPPAPWRKPGWRSRRWRCFMPTGGRTPVSRSSRHGSPVRTAPTSRS